MKDAIIVDVDLTFVDSGTPWMQWCTDIYGCEPDMSKGPDNGQMHYNLSKYFPEPKVHQIPAYDFWEDPYLYDKIAPLPNAVEVLEQLKRRGHPIRFTSHCKNGHFSSKVRMLKRYTSHFLDLEKGSTGDGFYATKVKSGVAGGVILDDRHEFLNQFGPDVLKIKFDTPYTQSEDLIYKPDLVAPNWLAVGEFLNDILL